MPPRSFSWKSSLSALVLAATAHAQGPSQIGAWDPPFSLPLIAIHSALLPTGKVLLFSAEHGVPGIHGWILDPVTLALTNVDPPAPWDPDCAGHSFLADGRLLVSGGTLSFTPLTGSKLAFVFDPWTEQWVQVGDMDDGRWYPTNLTLEDGRVITMAGLSDVPGTNNPDIELWDPATPGTWQMLGQRFLPYYPLLHLMPSGLIFMAGPDALTETYDRATDTWTPVDTTNFPGRYEACSVLMPPTSTRVMLIGGYDGAGQPTSSAEIIDLSAGSPQWTGTVHMAFPRMEHNAVLLPDENVLVVGGRSDNDASPTPVLTPEIFDLTTGTWTSMAPHGVPRRYHSTALLLPDGRVLAAGGDYQPSGEIYSPAYLFNGPRPSILSSPATIAYGSTFTIQFTGPTSTHAAALLALPCVTHSNNMSQRYVSLGVIDSPGGAVTLTAPPNGRIAPPGYYMLFVVSEDGVPSVSRMVRIVASGVAEPFCAGDGSTVACPCNNTGATGRGCDNSASTGGALLTKSGDPSLSTDTLVFTSSGERPTSFSIFLQGTSEISPANYGDGLRCTGGSLKRLYSKNASGGVVTAPQGGDPSVSARSTALGDPIPANATRLYQVYYRDPTSSFCADPPGSTFNVSSGLRVSWSP